MVLQIGVGSSRDDLARRGWQNYRVFWFIALIPLFGPLIYLSVRPPLPAAEADLKLLTVDG
ncbi:MAG: hypothetical protein HEQ35_23100 [Gloeotrichia echinulata IR180]|nr:hypothetical protein [Gloeotrichia echinulata DEX184]